VDHSVKFGAGRTDIAEQNVEVHQAAEFRFIDSRGRGDAYDGVRQHEAYRHNQPHEAFKPLFRAQRQSDDGRPGSIETLKKAVVILADLKIDLPGIREPGGYAYGTGCASEG
jgi:hypothetical protein